MKRKALPNKLSALIFVALADLRKAEKSPRYIVDMTTWHTPNSHCAVCFAGAVMAFSLGASFKQDCIPADFSSATARKLVTLDKVRSGNFYAAFRYLKPDSTPFQAQLAQDMQDRSQIPSYFISSARFKKEMLKAAKSLQKVGL